MAARETAFAAPDGGMRFQGVPSSCSDEHDGDTAQVQPGILPSIVRSMHRDWTTFRQTPALFRNSLTT